MSLFRREGGDRGAGTGAQSSVTDVNTDRASGIEVGATGEDKPTGAHGTHGARGGHYHCMGEGCGYKSRDKRAINIHSTKKNKHALSEEAPPPDHRVGSRRFY